MSFPKVRTLEAVFIVKQLKHLDDNINWNHLVNVIFPHYVSSDLEPVPVTIESMLRIYFLQFHYSLSAEEVLKRVHEKDAYREFTLINLDFESLPTTKCVEAFNALILEHNLRTEVHKALNLEAA